MQAETGGRRMKDTGRSARVDRLMERMLSEPRYASIEQARIR